MENKYKEGEVVYERVYPAKRLIIEQDIDKLYYCRVEEGKTHKPSFIWKE